MGIASSHQTRLNHNIFTTPVEREKYAEQQIVPSAEQCHNKTEGTTTMSDGDILADATEGICWHKNNYGKSKENGLDDCGVPEFLKVTLKRASNATQHRGLYSSTSSEKLDDVKTRKQWERKENFEGKSMHASIDVIDFGDGLTQ